MTIEETINKLAEAQIGHESRMTRLEESFKEALHQIAISIQQLTQLATAAYNRLDSLEEEQVHTDARLDALIDAQITLGQRFEQMTARVDRIGEHLDLVVALQSENAAQIKALIAAQASTDEQIKTLLDRNGATKPRRKITKMAKKQATKKKETRRK